VVSEYLHVGESSHLIPWCIQGACLVPCCTKETRSECWPFEPLWFRKRVNSLIAVFHKTHFSSVHMHVNSLLDCSFAFKKKKKKKVGPY